MGQGHWNQQGHAKPNRHNLKKISCSKRKKKDEREHTQHGFDEADNGVTISLKYANLMKSLFLFLVVSVTRIYHLSS